MSDPTPSECPRSNLCARPTLMSANGQQYRPVSGILNEWEHDQWQGVGMRAAPPGPTPARPPGAPPSWTAVIVNGYHDGARAGHYLRYVPYHPSTDPQVVVVGAGRQACQLVDAPPGTGKTWALVQRLRQLKRMNKIENIRANALVLSFSRTAVVELGARLKAAFPGPPGNRPEVRTVDSLVARLMRLGQPNYQQPNHDLRKREFIALLNNNARAADQQRDIVLKDGLARFDVIFIDEFQDIIGINAKVLLRMVECAIEGRRRFFPEAPAVPGILVLGDFRQYINFWQINTIPPEYRNLDPARFIRELRKILAANNVGVEDVKFQRNHRAAQGLQSLMADIRGILDKALSEIAPIPAATCHQRLIDRLKMAAGNPIQDLTELQTALGTAGAAYLARSNSEVLRMASFLHADQKLRSSFTMVTSPSRFGYPGWLGQILRAAVDNNIQNIGNENSVENAHGHAQIARQPDRLGLRLPNPAEAFELIGSVAVSLGVVGGNAGNDAISPQDLINAMRVGMDESPEIRLLNQGEAVWISTVHQSKGRQFPSVLLDGELLRDQAGGVGNEEDLETLRILYVAATRAMNSVRMLANNVMRGFGTNWWKIQIDIPDGHGEPLFGFEYWERWFREDQYGWADKCNRLWELYADCQPVLVCQNRQGAWRIDLGANLEVLIPQNAAQLIGLNGGPFKCHIIDLRCRVSMNSGVFFMPVMSSRLDPHRN
jgi:superfamily I DNA/RNA helicase